MEGRQRIEKLPRWAQGYIRDLERRVEAAHEVSTMLPWSEDGMQWYTILKHNGDKPLRLFTCDEFGTKLLTVLYGRDRVFVGRDEDRFHGCGATQKGGE